VTDLVVHDKKLGKDAVLALAGALEQYSNHVIARSVVAHAKHAGIELSDATKVTEIPGQGLTGTIEKTQVLVGNDRLLRENGITVVKKTKLQSGQLLLEIARGKQHLATLTLSDSIRPESQSVITALRDEYQFEAVSMLSGDKQAVAEAIAAEVGIQSRSARGELSPADKLKAVEVAVARAHQKDQTLLMVGDGINDAPSLERADVGVAIGKTGGEVAFDSADVVLLGYRLGHLLDAVRIGRGAITIATQGIWVGMGLSFIGMVLAAFGYLPPVAGALGQEAIDILVILNALRVLTI